MPDGLRKKWAQHPNWFGEYEFATARPLQRTRGRWFGLAPGTDVRRVRLPHVEYDVRERARGRDGAGAAERLFFDVFMWRAPRGPEDGARGGEDEAGGAEDEDEGSDEAAGDGDGLGRADSVSSTRPSDPSSETDQALAEAPGGNGASPTATHSKEHLTTRAELINAFDTLVTMEEQLYYALLDLDGAMRQWTRQTASDAAQPSPLGPTTPAATIVRKVKAERMRHLQAQYRHVHTQLRAQWLSVLVAADYFSKFLAFLHWLERSARLPLPWDSYNTTLCDPEAPQHAVVPDGLPFVWAFQVAHVLNGCYHASHTWYSLWHFHPVCEDPCAALTRTMTRAYAVVEELLAQARVPVKQWERYHRAYRKANPRRRTDTASLRRMRTIPEHFLRCTTNRSRADFIALLLRCYHQCADTKYPDWPAEMDDTVATRRGRSPYLPYGWRSGGSRTGTIHGHGHMDLNVDGHGQADAEAEETRSGESLPAVPGRHRCRGFHAVAPTRNTVPPPVLLCALARLIPDHGLEDISDMSEWSPGERRRAARDHRDWRRPPSLHRWSATLSAPEGAGAAARATYETNPDVKGEAEAELQTEYAADPVEAAIAEVSTLSPTSEAYLLANGYAVPAPIQASEQYLSPTSALDEKGYPVGRLSPISAYLW